MLRYIFKRVLQLIPLLLIISFIVFSLIYIAPFDAVDAITTPNMSQETIEILKAKHGLNEPFLTQYVYWLRQILSGDFGQSLVTQTSISEELLTRLPNTIRLILPTLFDGFRTRDCFRSCCGCESSSYGRPFD